MDERSRRLTVVNGGVEAFHSFPAGIDLEFGSGGLDHLPRLVHHGEASVLTASDYDPAGTVGEQFGNVAGLDPRPMGGTGFIPVPSPASSRPELDVPVLPCLGLHRAPTETVYLG